MTEHSEGFVLAVTEATACRIVEVRDFPDHTQTWVCACGAKGTPYLSIDLVNREWAAHIGRSER